ncbi:MAG: flagellar export chaperone FlgN [Oscillospiraceae bacterium]|nr:flagellar export chaperone FlgN [Oscillospiraceae bacterium]MDY6208203.1 flagellar export chaperone FlgN [Oscillospiraceae bacterium]
MDYNALITFFDEYNAHFRSFLKFEYSKMDMLNKGNIEELSASLSTEQAFIMKSNSLEKQRLALLGENSTKTFEQIVSEAPEEYKARLDGQRVSLSEMIYKIKEINDTANIIVSERLKKIRSTVGELDTYNGRGAVKKESAAGSTILTNA